MDTVKELTRALDYANEVWKKDNERWNDFLGKVMFGQCTCDTLVKKERCAVHGKMRKALEEIRDNPSLCPEGNASTARAALEEV